MVSYGNILPGIPDRTTITLQHGSIEPMADTIDTTFDAELPETGSRVSENRAKRILERRAEKVTANDIRDLTSQLQEKLAGLKDLKEGMFWFGTLIGRAKLLYGMFRDRDFQLEMATKLLIVGGLLYFILPTDLTPDFLPGIGYMDDAMVLGTLWKLVSEELERYVFFLRETGRADEDLETLAFGPDGVPSH